MGKPTGEELYDIYPTHVGMNRMAMILASGFSHKPHARGDEPGAQIGSAALAS